MTEPTEQEVMAGEVIALLNRPGFTTTAMMQVLDILGTDPARLPDALAAAREHAKALPA